MRFGIPYMGSKDGIVESICLNFPPAENFYDLFGGGFSVSHYMREKKSHRYKTIHYNEIKSDVVDLVKRAIAGEFKYSVFKPPWISREEFFSRKEHDAYIRCLWSFGNNQSGYLFGEDIEPIKRSLHMAVVFDEFDSTASGLLGFSVWPNRDLTIKQKRIYACQKIKFDKNKFSRFDLQQLEQLERLQQLEQLERLKFSSLDYRFVPILPNSIVYCDIPYKGTAGYLSNFNHAEFYEWAMNRPFPVYVSEYSMPDDFKLVYEVDKKTRLSNQGATDTKPERLYWNRVSLTCAPFDA